MSMPLRRRAPGLATTRQVAAVLFLAATATWAAFLIPKLFGRTK